MATFTNTGMAAVAGLINGETTNFFEYAAIGTDDTAAAATDTALGAEITTGGGARATATTSRVTTAVTNDTAQWVKTWSFSATHAIDECGILDSATTGILLMRHVFAATKNVEDGDSLELTVKMQVSSA